MAALQDTQAVCLIYLATLIERWYPKTQAREIVGHVPVTVAQDMGNLRVGFTLIHTVSTFAVHSSELVDRPLTYPMSCYLYN